MTVSRTCGFTVLAHYVHDTEHASAFTHFSLKQEHPSWGETAAHWVSGLHSSVWEIDSEDKRFSCYNGVQIYSIL